MSTHVLLLPPLRHERHFAAAAAWLLHCAYAYALAVHLLINTPVVLNPARHAAMLPAALTSRTTLPNPASAAEDCSAPTALSRRRVPWPPTLRRSCEQLAAALHACGSTARNCLLAVVSHVRGSCRQHGKLAATGCAQWQAACAKPSLECFAVAQRAAACAAICRTMKTLNLQQQLLTGPLPLEFGSPTAFQNLFALILQQNQLTGAEVLAQLSVARVCRRASCSGGSSG